MKNTSTCYLAMTFSRIVFSFFPQQSIGSVIYWNSPYILGTTRLVVVPWNENVRRPWLVYTIMSPLMLEFFRAIPRIPLNKKNISQFWYHWLPLYWYVTYTIPRLPPSMLDKVSIRAEGHDETWKSCLRGSTHMIIRIIKAFELNGILTSSHFLMLISN
jgi:hypothetical protein